MPLIAATLPLLVLLGVALAIDVRSRRIPNWLTGLVLVTGLTNAAWSGAPTPLGGSILGLLVGFAILILPFALGAMGGGDVKLLAGIGAWLGPVATLQTYCVAAIAGMLIVIVQCAAGGRLTELVRNSTLLAAGVANGGGARDAAASAMALRSVRRRQPWAVPATIGVVVTIAMNVV